MDSPGRKGQRQQVKTGPLLLACGAILALGAAAIWSRSEAAPGKIGDLELGPAAGPLGQPEGALKDVDPLPLEAPPETRAEASSSPTTAGQTPAPSRNAPAVKGNRPRLTLDVVDKVTGAPLKNVHVFVADGLPGRSQSLHQDGSSKPPKVLARGATSPLVVVPDDQLAWASYVQLAVGADGYGWTSATVHFTAEGRREVRLARAGPLTVRFEGSIPPGALLRLARGKERYLDRFVEGDVMELNDVAAGTYTATVHAENDSLQSFVLALAEVEMTAGRATELTLQLKSLEPLETATLSGLLVLPTEWHMERFQVNFALTSPPQSVRPTSVALTQANMTPVGQGSGQWSFEVTDLPPGSYSVELVGLGYAQALDLPPQGLGGFVFEVPPPVAILVAVEDAATGEPVETQGTLTWTSTASWALSRGGLAAIARDREGAFPLRVPASEVQLTLIDRNFSSPSLTFVPEEGTTVTLKATRNYQVVVEFRSEGVRPRLSDVQLTIKDEEGHPVTKALARSSFSGRVTLARPGRYYVEVPEIPGFHPVGPVEFEVRDHEPLTVQVNLVRK